MDIVYPKENLIISSGQGKEKRIPAGKWFINRGTPVGEPADFYEVKPYGGRKLIDPRTILEPSVYRSPGRRRG